MVVIIILLFAQVLSDLYLPTLMADIVDKGLQNNDVNYILRIGGFMLLIAAGGTLCAIIATYLSSKAAVGFGTILRQKIFSKVESFSLHEFDKLGTATLITRTTNDVTQIQQVSVLI
ncbi:MAG TPA: multidrug ABC transporter ATP-binding protein, partial [Desulfosporosinus sp.]|nr:multidrug ABC transporter ATP-binding protein [Desulfosporosinus sp.]